MLSSVTLSTKCHSAHIRPRSHNWPANRESSAMQSVIWVTIFRIAIFTDKGTTNNKKNINLNQSRKRKNQLKPFMRNTSRNSKRKSVISAISSLFFSLIMDSTISIWKKIILSHWSEKKTIGRPNSTGSIKKKKTNQTMVKRSRRPKKALNYY